MRRRQRFNAWRRFCRVPINSSLPALRTATRRSARLRRRIALAVKKRLQDQRCGNLVDDAPMILPRMPRFVKQLMRLMRSQPFIPEMNRQPGQLSQFGCETPVLFQPGVPLRRLTPAGFRPRSRQRQSGGKVARSTEDPRAGCGGVRGSRTGCAVSPSSSETAIPTRFEPTSSAR